MFIKSILKQKAKNGLHILFWALSYFILLNVFGYESVFSKVDYLYCFLFHLFLIPAVYISIYYIFPITGKKKKWSVYLILNGILVLALSWLNISFFNNWSAVLFPGYYFISYYSLTQVALIISIYIVISTLFKLSKSWFLLNDLQRKLLEAEKEKMDIELRGLRSQINPHFFFNTLNGLYALSLQNNPVLPSSILQLSGLMRYFIYDSKSERVPLDKEIAMIKDYIGLMKLRTEAETPIAFDIVGDIENHTIAPLIFISFIENAFKHGLHAENKQIEIHLGMIIEEDKIDFHIKNRKGNMLNEQFKNSEGIGLENVRRRLSLLYPGKHKLQINEDGALFEVQLEIDPR
jgi:sensor histidine kinase YesM